MDEYQDIELYPYSILRLLTADGFIEAYHEEISSHDTHEEAFEAVNQRYNHFFQMVRYSNYESFRRILSRSLKNGTMSHKK